MKMLAEALKSLSKYPDRPLIDYWRTVQGTPVGFHGDPKKGAGIPIAGPPVLTGGATSGNPLLEPLLKKYPKKTFIGDAIRKKNFPLSAINFIENFVGGDEKAIKARFAEMEKRIYDFEANKYAASVAKKESDSAFLYFAGKTITDNYGNSSTIPSYSVYYYSPIQWSASNNKFLVKDGYSKNQSVIDYVNDLNEKGVGQKRAPNPDDVPKSEKSDYYALYSNIILTEPAMKPPSNMLLNHFASPSQQASYLYKIMQMEGVAGTFHE
jgi:hypothetical protein